MTKHMTGDTIRTGGCLQLHSTEKLANVIGCAGNSRQDRLSRLISQGRGSTETVLVMRITRKTGREV